MLTWDEFKKDKNNFKNFNDSEARLIDIMSFLHATRIKMGISQTELGKKIGMSQPQIARLENMDVEPTFTTLNRYASGLGFAITLSVVPA